MNRSTIAFILAIAISVVAAGCGGKNTSPDDKPAVKDPEKPSATPATSPTRPPAPVEGGEAVEKEQKLSFSTYDTNFPDGWQFIDPDDKSDSTKYDVKTGVLRMVVPTNKDFYGDNMSAPRYVKALKGNFQIDTKVRATPSENYQGAGLLIFNDKFNYVRLERAFGGTGGGGSGIRLDISVNDEYRSIATPDDIPFDGKEVELRMIKNGGKVLAFWRADENAEWREAGEVDFPTAETVLAGLIVCNTASEFEAKFVNLTIGPSTVGK